jgi:hypothetical protein
VKVSSTLVVVRPSNGSRPPLGLRVGDVVEVRSEAEILATLDDDATLDALPFMPEMLQFVGRRFTVDKVAHKLCDTISGTGMRKMHNAVHLTDVRCDGGAHGGCQTACLIYWKEDWLKRVPSPRTVGSDDDSSDVTLGTTRISTATLHEKSRKENADDGEPRYSCQATELLRAAPDPLPLRQVGQYVADVRSGNVGPTTAFRALLVQLFNRFQALSTRLLPPSLRLRRGLRWGFVEGALTKTPTGRSDLQPGELVRIKSKQDIMATLNRELLNRGMGFEEEMSRYCGREARVLRRVDRCIDERTGRLLEMKNPCIVLENTICTGGYNANCPRSIYAFWREIWLERVDDTGR